MFLHSNVPTIAELKLQSFCCSRAMVSSIGPVTSGEAPAPSKRENLNPEYSGGLWLAVILVLPSALRLRIVEARTGVGVSRLQSKGVRPFAAKTSATASANWRPRK